MREEDFEFDQDSIDPMLRTTKVQLCLGDVLYRARDSGELVAGAHSAAEQLEINPDEVILCVLVENSHADPGIQVHCRLLEAFCWEYPIPVIKVNSSRKLKRAAGYSHDFAEPIHCVLVKSNMEPSTSLETVLKFTHGGPAPLLRLT